MRKGKYAAKQINLPTNPSNSGELYQNGSACNRTLSLAYICKATTVVSLSMCSLYPSYLSGFPTDTSWSIPSPWSHKDSQTEALWWNKRDKQCCQCRDRQDTSDITDSSEYSQKCTQQFKRGESFVENIDTFSTHLWTVSEKGNVVIISLYLCHWCYSFFFFLLDAIVQCCEEDWWESR